jgi:hypothetical protein
LGHHIPFQDKNKTCCQQASRTVECVCEPKINLGKSFDLILKIFFLIWKKLVQGENMLAEENLGLAHY